jgi:alpha-amylase
MGSLCFYFQIHQPVRIRSYHALDIGSHRYFNSHKNRVIFERVFKLSYLPGLRMLHHLLHKHPSFCVTLSFSGTALSYFERYGQTGLSLVREMLTTGRLELLAETSHHSLAALYSIGEFEHQIRQHGNQLYRLFGYRPTTFRNTELITNDQIANCVQDMGYKRMMIEGTAALPQTGRSGTYQTLSGLTLLARNFLLSDHIAFRFQHIGLNYLSQTIQKELEQKPFVGIYLDFETFGEHYPVSSGIFQFFQLLVEELAKANTRFTLPQTFRDPHTTTIQQKSTTSWADSQKDTSAWNGNSYQISMLQWLYSLESRIVPSGYAQMVRAWRNLQCSDHFYYMSTKSAADGSVHAYFSAFKTPEAAFANYNNILFDLQAHCDQLGL